MNEPVTLITQPKINWNKCVICQKDGATKNFTDKSWETLRNAANTRQDDILLKLSMFFEQEPRGIYHRKCYASYTHKGHLERIQKKKRKSNADCSEQCLSMAS